MSTPKTVVVLGGGVGGLTAANELRALLPSGHRVLLVERERDHLFTPSLLWLMVGERRREEIARPLLSLLRRGVELVAGEVTRIDPDRRSVGVGDRELAYGALVVALGAQAAPEEFPGYAEAAFNFFEPDGAVRVQEALRALPAGGGRVVVAVTTLPYKCPAAPYEAALLIHAFLRDRTVRPSEVLVITPEPQPMPVAGPVLGAAVSQLLAERGIALHTQRAIKAIEPVAHQLVFADGTREGFDLLAGVPPHRSPDVVRRSPLANESGWIPVDAHTLRTRFDDVYAVGDVTTVTLGNGKPLPKAGVFAHAEARAVAREIAASFNGTPTAAFDGKGYCWVEVGGGRAAFAEGDFYASPAPAIRLRAPGRHWHLGKVLFERSWIGAPLERAFATAALRVGRKATGVETPL